MRNRSLALSVAALALLSPLAAGCSGDDPKGDSDNADSTSSAGVGAEPGEPGVPGPKDLSALPPDCPFTAKDLNELLGARFTLQRKVCVFEATKGAKRISITREASADNASFDATRDDQKKSSQNFADLDVPGQAFVAWTDDELNITVDYLDNAGEYRYQISAIVPDEVGMDGPEELAEKLIELTVSSRED